MVNEPLPHQLTVGQLRQSLEGVPDATVIALELPAGYQAHPEMASFVNLGVLRVSGPIVVLSPLSRGASEAAV